MNPGNITSIASKAGTSGATSVASQTGTSGLVQGTSALKPNPTTGTPSNNITPVSSDNNQTNAPAKVQEFPGNNGNVPEENKAPEEAPKPGEKAGSGKQYNENGQIEDSSTKKTLKAVGRGAAAYATGGESLGHDKEIAKIGIVDNTLDKAADTLEKVPGMDAAAKELDEAGIVDGANDIMDAAGSLKNGDIGGAIESGEKVVKDVDKLKNYTKKKMMPIIIASAVGFLGFIVIFTAILSPVLGGYMDIVEGINSTIDNIGEAVGNFIFGEEQSYTSTELIGEIPNYESLSGSRQKVLAAASQAVAAGIPYGWGSHATAPGLEGIKTSGLDCSAFVEWAIWTGTGTKPGYLTTAAISSRIGRDFIEIDKSELKPGDIGLKRRGGSTDDNVNHTGIYAGNGQWFHETGGRTRKAVRNNYNGFKIYLRYTGMD